MENILKIELSENDDISCVFPAGHYSNKNPKLSLITVVT